MKKSLKGVQSVNGKPRPLALILTDTHLHKNNIELVKDIFKQAVVICKEKKIKYIFHLGDFFQSREAQPLLVLKEAKDILSNIAASEIKLFIIPGNHDKTDLESTVSYLTPLDKCNHELLSQETYRDFGNLRTIWLPFFKENGSYARRLESASKMIKSGSKNILLTHVGISGIRNNDGSIVDNAINTDLFKKFDKIFTGHYHDPQECDNIFYIGGAFQQNYGENGFKGFTILSNDGFHSFIQSNFSKFIKKKINIEDKEELFNFEKKYKNSKDNIRIILTGEKTKLQAFKKENLQDLGFDVKFENDILNNNIDINNEIIVFDRSNIKVAFDKFIEINQIKDKEFGLHFLEKIL